MSILFVIFTLTNKTDDIMTTTITNTLAHRIIQTGKALTWREAMVQASKEINLQVRMKDGLVTFTFLSSKGERTATGTQSLELIPIQYHPKDKGGNDITVSFWDLEVEEDFKWRSFSAGTLLSVKPELEFDSDVPEFWYDNIAQG